MCVSCNHPHAGSATKDGNAADRHVHEERNQNTNHQGTTQRISATNISTDKSADRMPVYHAEYPHIIY